jgi:hypothetical protein
MNHPTRRHHVYNDDIARRRRLSTLTRDDPGLPLWPLPRNRGMRYPADPPRAEEIIA